MSAPDVDILNEALVRELQHPSGTMDDPLLTAHFHSIEDAARMSGACTELQTPSDLPPMGLVDALRSLDSGDRAALFVAAVGVLSLVSAASWIWPWGFAK